MDSGGKGRRRDQPLGSQQRSYKVQILVYPPKPSAVVEAREVKYCIQGDGLAMADEKTKRNGFYSGSSEVVKLDTYMLP